MFLRTCRKTRVFMGIFQQKKLNYCNKLPQRKANGHLFNGVSESLSKNLPILLISKKPGSTASLFYFTLAAITAVQALFTAFRE